jgi:hypothetical protein
MEVGIVKLIVGIFSGYFTSMEDQRRPGGGQLWKRHREKVGRGGR